MRQVIGIAFGCPALNGDAIDNCEDVADLLFGWGRNGSAAGRRLIDGRG